MEIKVQHKMTIQIFSTEIKILDLVDIGPDPVVQDCSIDLVTTIKKAHTS